MQLLYVYIGGYIKVDNPDYSFVSNEPYRVLNETEFNFSNKFIFKFDKSEQLLDIRDNDSFVPDFFDNHKKIKSVSAIVGKNGTGKSSVIELIKLLQPDNIEDIPYKLILIYGDITEGTNQKFEILKHHELKCTLSQSFDEQNRIIDFYGNNYGVQHELPKFELPPRIKKIIQIHYSPVFEIKFSNQQGWHERHGDTHLLDISTSNLLEHDAENMTNGPSYSLSSREVLVRHRMSDVERQYLFASQIESNEFLDFKIPEFLELMIDSHDYRVFQDHKLVKIIRKLFETNNKYFNTPAKRYFIYLVIEHSLYNLVRYIFQNKILTNPEKLIIEIIRTISTTEGLNLKDYVSNFGESFNTKNQHLDKEINQRIEFISLLFDVPEINFRFGENTSCRLNAKKQIDAKIIDQYFELKKITGFLLIDWQFNVHNNGQLSSGEKAKFNLFSRFHSTLRKAEWQGKKLGNLLILVDEGDTLFHPEWQRTFLSDFIKGLKLIYPKTDSIQIIFTTHSPFVSSDLPWYSIIKLKEYLDTRLTEVIYDDNPTFASNIHDLFADNFYMGNGFVGEFAVEKIKSLLKRIDTATVASKDLIEREIQLIGEPFVKASLLDKLAKRLENEQN